MSHVSPFIAQNQSRPILAKSAAAPMFISLLFGAQIMTHIFDTLTAAEKPTFKDHLTDKLHELNLPSDTVEAFYDARNLPCPMPLLKAKVTLRHVTDNQALYLIATDQNSQKDLVTYCNKNALIVHTWHSHDLINDAPIYHFIIIKPTN